MTYYLNSVESGQYLFRMDRGRTLFLAFQSSTGWELYSRSIHDCTSSGFPDGEATEISKEAAAMLLFQAREPA